MRYIILFLLILISCHKSKIQSQEYILFVEDLPIFEEPKLKSEKIGHCSRGKVVELLGEVTLKVKNVHGEGGRLYHSFWKVNCQNKTGFLDFGENDKLMTQKDSDYLANNKQFIYDYFEYKDEITGFYENKNVYVEFFGNISQRGQDNKLLITNVVVNPMYGEEMSLVKIKEKQYLFFNLTNIILVSKVDDEGVYIEVIRGNSDFQTLNKKKFTKIIREIPNYPDPDKVDEPTKKSETENKFHK